MARKEEKGRKVEKTTTLREEKENSHGQIVRSFGAVIARSRVISRHNATSRLQWSKPLQKQKLQQTKPLLRVLEHQPRSHSSPSQMEAQLQT
jgi:hypothetical protein